MKAIGFGKFEVDDLVEVKIKGWTKYFPGAVTAYDESTKSYSVKFDDGDARTGIKAFHMRKIKGVSNGEMKFFDEDGKEFSSETELRKYRIEQKFTIKDLENQEVERMAGSISGNVLYIKNCSHSVIKILDHSEQIYVDDTKSSKILIGPCSGSVFFRNVKNCEIFVATKQFRARDCESCRVSLYSMTEPVIESSYQMIFYPYCGFYQGQTGHFDRAHLDPAINHYANVFDYTKAAEASSSPAMKNFAVLENSREWTEWKIGEHSDNPVNKSTKTKPSTQMHPFSSLVKMPIETLSAESQLMQQQIPLEIPDPDFSMPLFHPKQTPIIIAGKFWSEIKTETTFENLVDCFKLKSAEQIFCEDISLLSGIKSKMPTGEIRALMDYSKEYGKAKVYFCIGSTGGFLWEDPTTKILGDLLNVVKKFMSYATDFYVAFSSNDENEALSKVCAVVVEEVRKQGINSTVLKMDI